MRSQIPAFAGIYEALERILHYAIVNQTFPACGVGSAPMPIVIFILFFCIGLALREGAIMDPDTGWHIAAGDLIRALGRLPQTDPWSYTADGQRWYNISWAYDVGLSAIHSLGGLPAAVVATVGLYALAVALVSAIALRSSQSVAASFLVTLLAGVLLLPGMLVRPHVLTFFLVIAFYAILRFGSEKRFWLLPLLMILWANVHGGFLAGFVVIGAFSVEAMVARDYARCGRLVVIGALCAVALLATPYGWRLIDGAMLTMTSAMRELIAEWRPAAIGRANAVTVFVAAFFLLSALYERRIPLADKLLACFWLAMGISSMRMMQLAAILAAPYLAQALALRLRQSPMSALVEDRDRVYAAALSRPSVRAASSAIAAALVLGAFTPPLQRALAGKDAAFPARLAPDAAIDFLKAQYPALRLYNEYGMGGYLIFRERGATPVFVDGRADTAYPRQVLKDAVDIGMLGDKHMAELANEPAWRALVAKYDVEGFLISDRMRLYDVLSRLSDWTKVYEDENAALFVRGDLVRRRSATGGARAGRR